MIYCRLNGIHRFMAIGQLWKGNGKVKGEGNGREGKLGCGEGEWG